jgi:ribosomal subunit interface protein
MSIEVHVRHETEGSTKKFAEVHAEQCAEQIIEKFNKVDNVHVVIDHQRFMYEAEFVVHVKGHTIEAKEHAENLRSAIDTAAARVTKQLRKLSNKVEAVHTHQAKHV